jgi:hypothetical protein
MPFRTLAAAGLLAAALLPIVSHAQTTAPHFYVGVGANLLSSTPFNSAAPRLLGPALTAGIQLNPHVALQIGASYQWQKEAVSELYVATAPGGPTTIVTNTREYHYKYLLVPVLLRYTFAPAAERFHVDALGGVTLLYSASRGIYDSTPSTAPPAEYKSAIYRASLTLGPAIRYAVASQLELTASSLVSAAVGDSYYRFSDRFFLNTSVGINYTFGQR